MTQVSCPIAQDVMLCTPRLCDNWGILLLDAIDIKDGAIDIEDASVLTDCTGREVVVRRALQQPEEAVFGRIRWRGQLDRD